MFIAKRFFKKKFLLTTFVLSIVFSVASCGKNNNPYLGVWMSDPDINGSTEQMELKKKSIKGNGDEIYASYIIDPEKIGITSVKNGEVRTIWLKVIDTNTLEFQADDGYNKLIYRRNKS